MMHLVLRLMGTGQRKGSSDPVPGYLHRWTFDADDGTDEAGTLDMSPSGDLTFEDGAIGRAAVFNNTNAKLVSDIVPPMPSIVSLSCWMKGTGTGANDAFLSSYGNLANGSLGGFIFHNDATGKPRTICYTGAGKAGFVYGNTFVRDGDWHHCVFTYDGTDGDGLNLYLDGQLDVLTRSIPSGFGGDINPSGVVWTIGDWNGSSWMSGSLDDIRVYDRVLSLAEIQALYAMGPPPRDSDAVAFLAAAGVTDSDQRAAVDELVTSLKDAGIWAKLHAIYPLVGGTADAHKWNLKDPRNLDAAYRLVFNGSWAHDENGITGDGSTGYANTFLNMSTSLGAASGSLGVYSRTSTQPGVGVNVYDMGAGDGDVSKATLLICRYNNNNSYWCYGISDASFVYNVNGIGDGDGFYVCNRQNSTNTEGWRNGSKIGEGAKTVSLSARPLYIGAFNRGGTAQYFSPRNYAFAFIADGLTDDEQAALYTAVQAYQTSLGRAV